jgi:hypothetical protein
MIGVSKNTLSPIAQTPPTGHASLALLLDSTTTIACSHSSFAVFLRNAGTFWIAQRCRGGNIHDSLEIMGSRRMMDKHCLSLRKNTYGWQILVYFHQSK